MHEYCVNPLDESLYPQLLPGSFASCFAGRGGLEPGRQIADLLQMKTGDSLSGTIFDT